MHTPADRTFRWISSVEGSAEALASLHDAMMQFYSDREEREAYQGMIDGIDETPDDDSSTAVLSRFLMGLEPEHVVEVGCANGRLYRNLRNLGFEAPYMGVEVAEHLIRANREHHPESDWQIADAYALPVADDVADVVCSEFVLEHLVYPERALCEMIRVVRPGGHLVLKFPDFVEAGRFSSQALGLTETRSVTSAIRQGRLIDAVVSLYDSRVRLPNALQTVHDVVGPFPVNLRPACLTYRNTMYPDIDAVYIASKREVESWATAKGHSVRFPEGTEGLYAEKAFLAIQKAPDTAN